MTASLQRAPRRRQRGVYAILYAVLLVPLMAMIGLALDVAYLFARQHELRNIGDSAAVAAARALDGSTIGVGNAVTAARTAATANQYRFMRPLAASWSDAALRLGPSPGGPWTPAGAVSAAQAATFFYARVDTGELDDSMTRVRVTLLQVVRGQAPAQKIRAVAVAGRGMSTILPLGICALASAEFSKRVNGAGNDELLEFGFRRGVSYDLLNLSSYDTTPRHYIINPFAFPPAAGRPEDYSDEVLKPLACTGAIPAPVLAAGTAVHVQAGFPVAMAVQLNSRFNEYLTGSVCTTPSAPPDVNIKDFRGGYVNYWMNNSATKLRPSAEPADITGTDGVTRRLNVAHGDGAGATRTNYGPLWAYSRPLRFDSATGAGGAEFSNTDWGALYPVGSGLKPSTTYANAQTPYTMNEVPHASSPSGVTALLHRRIINVPLLSCPVAGSTATVMGIGRFLLVAPANKDVLYPGIHGEFAGLTTYGKLSASTVLYQ